MMATTAIFAEILIIGLQAGAWLALLAASIFGTENLPIQDIREWQIFLILPVVAIAYVLGIMIDRVADTAFMAALKRIKGEKPKVEFSTMRLRILMHNDAVAKFIDYQRSRLRISRATAFNLFFIVVTGVVFLIARTDFSPVHIAIATLVGVAFLAVSLYVTFRIEEAQTKTLEKAFHMIEESLPMNNSKHSILAAAICYRRSSRGIEFLLVRTSDGLRWTFPKGHIQEGESLEKAAEREAKEEAGGIGKIRVDPIAEYSVPLQFSDSKTEKQQVVAFLLEVTDEINSQEQARDPTWFEPQEARKKLAECREQEFATEHERVLDTALEKLRK